jgi:pyruvate kinase
LQFSSGVYPVYETEHPENWNAYVADWLRKAGIEAKLAVVTEGPSVRHPDANNRLEIVDLDKRRGIKGDPGDPGSLQGETTRK